MADVSYTREEAGQALSQTQETAANSEAQMKDIMTKVGQYFENGGTAMGGQLGNFMGSSFSADIKPIFDQLNRELNEAIEDVKFTNTNMDQAAQETESLYKG